MSTHDVGVRFNYGYTYQPQAICRCGWTGPQRMFEARAMRDANKHWRVAIGWTGSAAS